MLLQTLPLVAMIFVIGFGLLTSQLVAVRHSIQQATTRDLGLAMDGAVIDVTRVIASYVRDNGTTEGPWRSPTEQSPKTSTCAAYAPNQVCLYTTYRWRFTGASSGAPLSADSRGGTNEAVNLQKALIDEQRVSVEIMATISTGRGDLLGGRTRSVTFRVFNAGPYAVPVGSYDVTSHLNHSNSSQGDTGGDVALRLKAVAGEKPDPQSPDRFTDTTLHVALDCENSVANSRPDPTLDNSPAYIGIDAPNLPWGQKDYAYETPCAPRYPINSPPPGAPAYPVNSSYLLSQPSSDPERWSNDRGSSSTWTH